MTINVHECNSLTKNGVYLNYDNERPSWTLTIQKEATETDLEENGYLENVGDIIWVTSIDIRYCPYCGEQLPGLESIDLAGCGHFQHHDFSRWE